MKILHFSYFGRLGTQTGIVQAVLNISSNQKTLGNDVKIIIPFNHPAVDNINVFFASSFNYIVSFVNRFNPDIVVFDGLYDKYQIRLSYYLKKLKIPYVLVFHGGASEDNAKKHWLKKKVANMLLFNRFVRWAAKVVYLSENEKRKSIFHSQNPNYAIIPNGVTIPITSFSTEKHKKIVFLFFSRLDWYGKGLDILYEVLKKLSNDGLEDEVVFRFYGTKESTIVDSLFEFGNLTEYCGYVTGEEKDKAFKDADLFILPSRSEGMPIAVLEALSYGIPCILTPETNMSEFVVKNKCGWEVDLAAEPMFQMIKTIIYNYRLKHKELYTNSISAAKVFDWKVVAEQSLSIYKQILDHKYTMSKDRIYFWWHIAHWLYGHHLRLLAIIVRAFVRIVFSCDIPYQVKIGKRTVFPHDGLGIILHNDVEIGENCKILHGVTMGGNGGLGVPKIGNNVLVGAHAIILGEIVVGDNAIIGAGAVVTKDVPERAVVVGNPAKILKYRE